MKTINIQIPELPYAAEEALNRLRVNVKFSGKEIKTIMISSSLPNEGKSHVAVYLWKMMAEMGFRTVLVDCDLRKSVLKKEMRFQTCFCVCVCARDFNYIKTPSRLSYRAYWKCQEAK